MFVSIGKTATMLGVSVSTLRRWDKDQKFPAALKTLGGHRRYDLTSILTFYGQKETNTRETHAVTSEHLPVVIYARVSGAKQAQDLETQSKHLKSFVEQHGWKVIAEYHDIGSGLNDQRKGLLRLVHDLPVLRPAKIVVSYLDRLARFGTAILQAIGEVFGAEIVVTHVSTEELSFEEQLTQDMIALVTSFAGKLHRARRGQQTHTEKKVPFLPC